MVEIVDSNGISDEEGDLIYNQIKDDINWLREIGLASTQDDHMYSIGDYEYCVPILWSLYAEMLFSRRSNCNFCLDDRELAFLQTLLPLKLGQEVTIGRKSNAVAEVLEMYIPEVKLWPDYLLANPTTCNACANMKKCDNSYLNSIEKNLFVLLKQRENEEILEFRNVLDSLCDTKFKNATEINPCDLIRELNIEKVKVQQKINKSHGQVKRWSRIIGIISAGLSLGALFGKDTLAAIGGVGVFASETIEQLNEYIQKKYNWISFVNQQTDRINK